MGKLRAALLLICASACWGQYTPAGGSGNVTGPGSSVNGGVTCFNGTTGQLLQNCPTLTVSQGGTGVTTQSGIVALTPNNALYASLASGSTDDARITTQAASVVSGGMIVTSSGSQSWAACPTFGSTDYALYVLGTVTLGASCTIPANITMQFGNGVLINPNGHTLTFAAGSWINVPSTQQIFPSSFTGSIVINYQEVPAGYFGATPNTTDNAIPIANAIASGAPAVLLTSGTYNVKTANTILIPESTRLKGTEASSTQINCSTLTVGACVAASSVTGTPSNVKGGAQDLTINCGTPTSGVIGLYLGGDPTGTITPTSNLAAIMSFSRIQIGSCGYGIDFGDNAYILSFNDSTIYSNTVGVEFLSTANNSGESIYFAGGAIKSNTTGMDLFNGNFTLSGTVLDQNGTGITGTSATVTGTAVNLEQLSGALLSTTPPSSANSAYPFQFSCTFCVFREDSNTGTDAAMLTSSTYNTKFNLIGSSITANHTVTDFLSMPSGGQVPIIQNITEVVPANVGALASLPYTKTGIPSVVTWDTSGNLSGVGTISSGQITIASTNTAILDNNDLIFDRTTGSSYIQQYGTGENIAIKTSASSAGDTTDITFTTTSVVSALKLQAPSFRSGSASNTDVSGELSFSSATTASYTFSGTYTSHPEIVLQPQFDIGSGNRCWVTYTGTTSFTANCATAVTGTITYHQLGRN